MSKPAVVYRAALWRERDDTIKLSRTNPYTTAYASPMFSGEAHFDKEWIGVALIRGRVVGFVCLRHKVREPATVIYDIVVDPAYQRRGIGAGLVRWAMESSPHELIKLNVDDTNKSALAFYKSVGFRTIGTGTWSEGKASARGYTTLSISASDLEA